MKPFPSPTAMLPILVVIQNTDSLLSHNKILFCEYYTLTRLFTKWENSIKNGFFFFRNKLFHLLSLDHRDTNQINSMTQGM